MRRAGWTRGPVVESHEPRTLMTAAVALLSDNVLLEFDTAAPSITQRGVVVTGLRPGEHLASIDYSPFDGLLYGVATSGAAGSIDGLYRINLESGAARRIGELSGLAEGDEETGRAIDFNPMTGLLSVASETGQARFINVATGQSGWMSLTLDEDDALQEIAFSNNTARSASTTLYGLSYANDWLTSIDIDSGDITAIGDIGFPTGRLAGFDISADGIAHVAITRADPGGSLTAMFGAIDLATGQFTQSGVIGGQPTTSIRGLTVRPIRRAPVLDTSRAFEFATVAEDSTVGRTMLVRDLLGTVGGGGIDLVTDPDTGAAEGAAITGFDRAFGTWSYTLDGTTWTTLPAMSLGDALLLPADATAALRFVPAADRNTAPSALSLRAWDQTAGIPGRVQRIDGPELAGSISDATGSVNVPITNAYDTPRLTPGPVRQTIRNNSYGRPFREVSITSPDGAEVVAKVRAVVTGRGVFSAASLETAGFEPSAVAGEYVFRGEAFEVQAMVRILRFVPAPGVAPIGGSAEVGVRLVVGDARTPSARTFNVTFTVLPVNTAPVFAGLPATASGRRGVAAAVFGAARIVDIDAAQTQTVTVKLSTLAKGGFTAASLRAAGFRTIARGKYEYTGTAARGTTALRKLRFQFKAGLPASVAHRVSVTTTVNDGLAAPASKVMSVSVVR